MIAIIAAIDKNRVIGKADRIPWRLQRDLRMLKQLTLGQTVILGRKTYDSMVWYYDRSGREMPGKTYIIVTRNADYPLSRSNARTATSPEDALRQATKLGGDAYVIGGEHIFEAFLPLSDRIYLTEVQTEVDGDAYFPALRPEEWYEVSREHFTADEKNEHNSDLVVYERS
jgi:dihydrofolate reductase